MNAYTLFAILILIVSLLLILVILVQNPKGGGLSSSFGGGGGGQMLGGVKQTNDFLEKSTWTLVAALIGFILLSNFVIPRHNTNIQDQTELKNILDSAPKVNMPTAEPVKQENAGTE
ncbi:MAG: preprotein translocase subunit SecG [Flavobacteriales bacterium]|nr:preprotein translocase subunit SecG [Flavobacteriales bacterium]